MALILDGIGNGGESDVQTHHGGLMQLALWGHFDGGTIQVHVSQDGSPFLPLIQSAPFISPDVNDINMAKGSNWKLVLVGAGASAGVFGSVLI